MENEKVLVKYKQGNINPPFAIKAKLVCEKAILKIAVNTKFLF